MNRIHECVHCSTQTQKPLLSPRNSALSFCCLGCMSVYELLHSSGLQDFYQYKKEGETFFDPGPVVLDQSDYSFIDDPDFLQDYESLGFQGLKQMRFYLEGIHCTACLWLVEKVKDKIEDVQDIKLDLSTSIVTLTLNAGGRYQNAVKILASLGFKPQALKKAEDHHYHALMEDRKDMIRIGVAAAASMNIMLYTISIYAGAPAQFSSVFSYLIIILSVPVVFYSATPFYLNAWVSLKHQKISLDLPISVALIYGFLRGVIEIIHGGVEFYFDTLCILVFLLLLSRFVVKKWGRRGLTVNALSPLMGLSAVQVLLSNGETQERHPDYLKEKDCVEIQPGQVIPADGILKSEKGFFQTALLTGESVPHELKQGQRVLGGYQNAGQKVVIELTHTVESSLLGQMLEQLKNQRNAQSAFAMMADRVASRLVPAVFMISLILLGYFWWQGDLLEGERRALSLIIITCPCALGLATPLALARSLNIARRLGIVLKNENDFERIAPVKRIILDKTGTLTLGQFCLIEESYNDQKLAKDIQSIILALEASSEHPLAQAFRGQWQGRVEPKAGMTDVQEIPGVGVKGRWNNNLYEIRASQKVEGRNIGEVVLDFLEDGIAQARFTLGDQIRPEAKDIVNRWQKFGYDVWIISGDKKSHVQSMAQYLGIRQDRALGELLPFEKAHMVESLKPALMIGDGANDAQALKSAEVGIAVKGSMQLALKSSHLYTTKAGLNVIKQLLEMSQATVSLIKRNLNFSLIYNLVSISLASMGFITPLMAAIIMPLSSITVVISTVVANRPLRQLEQQELTWKS